MRDLNPLLKSVSRSFYLSLRVLPAEIRPQICAAYLLARASDTVADTQVVPREERLSLLREMKEGRAGSVKSLAPDQVLPGERELLERLEELLRLVDGFKGPDKILIRELHETIVSGQIFDLERFPAEDERGLIALEDDAETDKYTFLVAGCVGEFWTRICAADLPGLEDWDVDLACARGVRFGKGLQLVNILRDIPRDLRIGRCYLPVKDPRRLLDPDGFDGLREEYSRWLDKALAHLDEGWRYALSIPPSQWRLRLACAWPVLLGVRTIGLLRQGNPLDPGRVIMVPQSEVYWMLVKTFFTSKSDALLDNTYRNLLRSAD